MRLFNPRVYQGISLIACLVLATSGSASAQATSTFNGRVLDQGDAVLPGVSVAATNTSTGVVRTTVTNQERLTAGGIRPRQLQLGARFLF